MIVCFRCGNYHNDELMCCEDCLPHMGADLAVMKLSQAVKDLEHVELEYLRERLPVIRRASEYLKVITQHLEKEK